MPGGILFDRREASRSAGLRVKLSKTKERQRFLRFFNFHGGADVTRPQLSDADRGLWPVDPGHPAASVPSRGLRQQTGISGDCAPQVNMFQPKSAGRILLALTLCSSFAIDAYGWSPASFLHPSIRQEERAMSFVAWAVLGLAAGFIGSQLVDRGKKSILPDILLGVVGAMAGGWLFYAFGPAGVNGLHLYSHLAAVIGSLVFLLAYYALRQV